jgi:hypothetical protein
MRKVLLATTALVAMSVTAAQAADVSISGYAEFTYDQPNNDENVMASDGGIVIKATTTTDSGITFSAVQDSKFEGNSGSFTAAGTTAKPNKVGSGLNDSYVQASGDFGTIKMGASDTALDSQDSSFTGRSLSIQGAGEVTGSKSTVLIGADSTAFNYTSPSINGLQLVGSIDEANNRTDIGAKYEIGGVTLGYQTRSSATDSTLVGVGVTMAGVRLQAATVEHVTGGSKTKVSDVGFSYTTGAITLAGYTSKATGASADTNNEIGVMYDVGGGASVRATSYANKIGSKDTTGFYSEFRVTF